MNQLLYMFAGSVCTLLIGCGSGGGAPADAKAEDPNAPGVSQPSQPGGSIPVQLTYYSLSKTVYPVNGFTAGASHSYTATGSCVVYNSQTYCWDDGVKTVHFSDFSGNNYGPFTYDYWAQNLQGQSIAACNGGCGTDPLTIPAIVSQNVETALTLAKINLVFSSGQAKQVTCTLTGSDLDCVDFSIDLTQVPF